MDKMLETIIYRLYKLREYWNNRAESDDALIQAMAQVVLIDLDARFPFKGGAFVIEGNRIDISLTTEERESIAQIDAEAETLACTREKAKREVTE